MRKKIYDYYNISEEDPLYMAIAEYYNSTAPTNSSSYSIYLPSGENISVDEANEIKAKLEEAGAEVEVK